MKKTVLLFSIFVMAAVVLQAQANIGLKGGLNFTSLPSTQTGESADYSIAAFSDSYTGYHLGIVGMFVFRGGFFQPELLYTQTGRDMLLGFEDNGQEEEFFVQKYSHLVMPLHAGAKFGALKISAGPVFSFLINDWNDLGIEESFQEELNKLTLGYQLGAGLRLGNLVLDLKYEGNFNNFGEGVTIGNQTIKYDTRPNQVILSIGLLF